MNTISDLEEHLIQNVGVWEWSNTYDGFDGVYEHRIIWDGEIDQFQYGSRTPNNPLQWVFVTVDNPERIGANGTVEGARQVVGEFYKLRES